MCGLARRLRFRFRFLSSVPIRVSLPFSFFFTREGISLFFNGFGEV